MTIGLGEQTLELLQQLPVTRGDGRLPAGVGKLGTFGLQAGRVR